MVQDLVKDINVNLAQRSSSRKDEVRVMEAILNDKDYKVGEYSTEGKVGEYCPYEDSRKMLAHVMQSAIKLNSSEAKEVAEHYNFDKNDSQTFVNLSKEFVNTYVRTGRKLPLGNREDMSVTLRYESIPETEKKLPKNGLTKNSKDTITIPAHSTIKVSGSCPKYLKK